MDFKILIKFLINMVNKIKFHQINKYFIIKNNNKFHNYNLHIKIHLIKYYKSVIINPRYNNKEIKINKSL
jgi:hypothetical protein